MEIKAINDKSTTTAATTITISNIQVLLHNLGSSRGHSLAVSASASKNYRYITM